MDIIMPIIKILKTNNREKSLIELSVLAISAPSALKGKNG